MFGAKTQIESEKYMLASLALPRTGKSLVEEGKAGLTLDLASAVGTVTLLVNLQDIAKKYPVFVTAMNGRAQAIVRLDDLSSSDLQQVRTTVQENKILLIVVLANCPTCSVLGLRFAIYDNLTSPIVVEAPRDIRTADVQDFLSAILENGTGEFHLYTGYRAEPVASGIFSLRMPPFRRPEFPYKTTNNDLTGFWQLLIEANKHLKEIPVNRQDFEAAIRFYEKNTSFGG